jgi:hypothetical protein
MGVGVAGCAGKVDPAVFDNLILRDIQNPYKIVRYLTDTAMNVGTTMSRDITSNFGHYIGDFFNITAQSTDTTVVKAIVTSTPNPAYDAVTNSAVEQFLKNVVLTGVGNGVANINVSTNIAGYKMTDNFIVVVNGGNFKKDTLKNMVPPSPWIFADLGGPSKPSMMEFTNTVNQRTKIRTINSDKNGTEDNIAALYQNYSNADSLGMIAYIDTVKNTGDGSFGGLMVRNSFTPNDQFVSFSVGSYEGLRFSYRWANGATTAFINDTTVKLPCWIRLNKKQDAQNNSYYTAYYSYDNLYWKSFLKYPFPLNFTNASIVAGFAVSGGTVVSNLRPEYCMMHNFDIKKNKPFDQLLMADQLSALKENIKISPNPVSGTATVQYKVVKPGQVRIAVYDSYGILRDIVFSGFQNTGTYSQDYTPQNISKSGVYLLKYVSEGDYQITKFIYNK